MLTEIRGVLKHGHLRTSLHFSACEQAFFEAPPQTRSVALIILTGLAQGAVLRILRPLWLRA